ncbi:MAG: ankyrin repeat domain-containing protein, partial [Chlamydiota bacterium]
MKKCLARGANYDAIDEQGRLSMHYNLNTTNIDTDGTALHIACWAGHEHIIEYLVGTYPLLLDKETTGKRTPLFSLVDSIKQISDVCFTNLLWAGAKLSHRDNGQKLTPLFLLACEKEKNSKLKIGLAWLSIFETLDKTTSLL